MNAIVSTSALLGQATELVALETGVKESKLPSFNKNQGYVTREKLSESLNYFESLSDSLEFFRSNEDFKQLFEALRLRLTRYSALHVEIFDLYGTIVSGILKFHISGVSEDGSNTLMAALTEEGPLILLHLEKQLNGNTSALYLATLHLEKLLDAYVTMIELHPELQVDTKPLYERWDLIYSGVLYLGAR